MNRSPKLFGHERPSQPGLAEPAPVAVRLPIGWLALLAALTLGMPAAFAIGLDGDDGWNALRRHHLDLVSFVTYQPLVASILFMVVFALSVAISLPGVSLLTMVGGFLFGWLEAAVYAQIAATMAAAMVFVLARRALARPIDSHAGPTIRRFADGFKRNAFGYVMFLNLVPIFPFGMIIALPAACGVRLWTFVIGGFLGILPGTILLTHLGSGLGRILRQPGPIELTSFLSPEILLGVVGLAALSLLPLAFRHLTRRDAV